MKKIIIAICLTMAVFVTYANELRIDIRNKQIKLTPINEADLMKASHMSWIKNADEQARTVLATSQLTDQYKSYKMAFLAEESGDIPISIMGGWAAKAEDYKWINVTNLKINGEPVLNSNLARTFFYKRKNITAPVGLDTYGYPVWIAKQDNSPASMKVNHKNYIIYTIKNAVAGERYDLEIDAKNYEDSK